MHFDLRADGPHSSEATREAAAELLHHHLAAGHWALGGMEARES